MGEVIPALIGKHPDYGDFIRAGLPSDMAEKLMRWMDSTLAKVRSEAGDDWEAFWDGAPSSRLWLGRKVLGQTCLGIMVPSRDKVGRRYPLLVLALGVGLPPPFQDAADDVLSRIEDHLALTRGGAGGAAALLEGLDLSDLPAEGPPPETVLWAHHPEGKLESLLRSAAKADHMVCAQERSYWWMPARDWRAAAWLGCDGLPAQPALSWLLAGQEAAMPEPAPQPDPVPMAPPPDWGAAQATALPPDATPVPAAADDADGWGRPASDLPEIALPGRAEDASDDVPDEAWAELPHAASAEAVPTIPPPGAAPGEEAK